MYSKENNRLDIDITEKQLIFITSTSTEVLFGGAAGGGKSYGQCVDAFLYAMKYVKSKQIIFRKTYPELQKSILRTMQEILPIDKYNYNKTEHTFKFFNGSLIDCGYLQTDDDVYRYQSAEYDIIRFDELTHFSEFMYIYMFSRLRGVNGYPKQIKSSTNPTGSGRVWVKDRFVDIGVWGEEHKITIGYKERQPIKSARIFIPSKIYDNPFLMSKDPNYLINLENLPESEKQGLLNGEWDYFDGQYFDEFKREIHTSIPFKINKEWRKYISIDYGLDMLAAYWIAVDNTHHAYVYKELCESNLPISTAATKILNFCEKGEEIYTVLAPPDLWNRSQETGKSKALIFEEAGLTLTKSNNDRESGWLAIKELLKVDTNGSPRMHIFHNCKQLIKNLPELQRDNKKPTDCSLEPHEITHSCDALRYFAIYWTSPNQSNKEKKIKYRPDQLEDYRNSKTQAERDYLIKKLGGKPQ